jgi:hypothetical protein
MEMNGTVLIKRPLKEVEAYVLDVSNDVNWRYGVDESGMRSGHALSPGAIGYTRVGKVEVDWKILALNPGEGVEWELLNGPFPGRGGYQFKAVEGGTQFTLVSDVRPTGACRLLGPLFRRIGRRRNQSDVEKLRALLESRTHPS